MIKEWLCESIEESQNSEAMGRTHNYMEKVKEDIK